MCEPEGMCVSFKVYSGKGRELSDKGHTVKVVMHLMIDKLGVGHALSMANNYLLK